jgi:tetratricopeptide (TPR) repeat protein
MKLTARESLPLVLSVFAVCSLPVRAGEAQWIEIQSPHFSVITDAGERRGRDTAVRFEQMRAVFGALMTKANVNLPMPLQIVAFRNGKELKQVAPLWHGKPTDVAGLFEAGQDRGFIMLDMSVENPWSVVFHEYAHQLMNGNLSAEVDPWLEEGFAEYFSSIEVDGKQARVGKIPHQTYEIIQQTGLMKAADLLNVRQNSATYNESGDHRTVFYAESAMLVHYLYDNGLIPKLTKYFTLKIDKNVGVEAALQQAFGMNAAQFDKALREYISSGRYKYYALPTPTDIVEKGYAIKPLTALDASTAIADIHLHSIDYHEKAVVEFQEILKADPNNAAACRGLGYAYLQKGNFKDAGEYFKRAAAADSKDPRVHYYSAMLMTRDGSLNRREELPEITRELETAISLDPNFADAYTLLAFAAAQSGEPSKALADMQKAVTLSPRNDEYRFDLAQMYLSNQKFDDAISLLKTLINSSNPEVAQRGVALLNQVQEIKTLNASQPVRVAVGNAGSDPVGEAASPAVGVDTSAVKFTKGTIVSVDCSTEPSATLNVLSGTKTMQLRVTDRKRVLVLGASGFSCDWKKAKVALNYRESEEGSGTVVSIEVQ